MLKRKTKKRLKQAGSVLSTPIKIRKKLRRKALGK